MKQQVKSKVFVYPNLKGQKNWNIMAGSNEYKLTHFLNFLESHTFERFSKDQFIRNFLWIRSFLIALFFLWTLLYFMGNGINIIEFVIGNLLLILSYKKVFISGNPTIARFGILFLEFKIQSSIFRTVNHTTYLVLFGLPTLISGFFTFV